MTVGHREWNDVAGDRVRLKACAHCNGGDQVWDVDEHGFGSWRCYQCGAYELPAGTEVLPKKRTGGFL